MIEPTNHMQNAFVLFITKATHARHHTEHVVVRRVDGNTALSVDPLGRGSGQVRRVGEVELELGIVNTRHVYRAGRLVLLGADAEGV